MSKIHRGNTNADGEPLSAGRVEYLEAARQRVRNRRLRRTAIIVAALTLIILFATGAVGASIARVKDLVDTVHIALTPAVGWPQQTGLADLTAVQPMSGSFVAMDKDTCVVYSLRGTRLASIQSGFARPALAAGKTRFVLYNRSGNELRVESRTQNRPAARVFLHHAGAAALGPDQYTGHPAAHSLCGRQPPSGRGGSYLQRGAAAGKPVYPQSDTGRPRAAGQ